MGEGEAREIDAAAHDGVGAAHARTDRRHTLGAVEPVEDKGEAEIAHDEAAGDAKAAEVDQPMPGDPRRRQQERAGSHDAAQATRKKAAPIRRQNLICGQRRAGRSASMPSSGMVAGTAGPSTSSSDMAPPYDVSPV